MTGITNPTEEYFKDGLWGWDGTRWRKLPLLFGYTDHYAERVFTENASAGTNTLSGTIVPAGEIWVINAVSGINMTSVISHIRLRATNGSMHATIVDAVPATADFAISATCSLVLKAGDKIQGVFHDCVAGDDLYLDIWGYKMAVT